MDKACFLETKNVNLLNYNIMKTLIRVILKAKFCLNYLVAILTEFSF